MTDINFILKCLGVEGKKAAVASLPFTHSHYVETYDLYDGPINYSIKGDDGQLYIVNWAGWAGLTQKTGESVWLYFPVSKEYLNEYKTDKTTLQKVIKNTREKFYIKSILNGKSVNYLVSTNSPSTHDN